MIGNASDSGTTVIASIITVTCPTWTVATSDSLLMESTRNPKRPRPDESRDEDLYFEDGNVVISASNNVEDPSLVYFRVHKSVLSKQSVVFRDMFSLPSFSDTDNMYDGVPLIYFHDDAKEL
jgi:hypothetical protein